MGTTRTPTSFPCLPQSGGGSAAALLLVRVFRTIVGVGLGEARHQGGCRRLAGKGVSQIEFLERWQSAAVEPERSGEEMAQPASVTWMLARSSHLSFVSTPFRSAATAHLTPPPAAAREDGVGVRRLRPSSPNGLTS